MGSDYVHIKYGIVKKVGAADQKDRMVIVRKSNGDEVWAHEADLTKLTPSNTDPLTLTKEATLQTNELLSKILIELRELHQDFRAVQGGANYER